METDNSLKSQCLWCGTQDVDMLHEEYILPLCPKCLKEFKEEF